jgi:hypothetical protein
MGYDEMATNTPMIQEDKEDSNDGQIMNSRDMNEWIKAAMMKKEEDRGKKE